MADLPASYEARVEENKGDIVSIRTTYNRSGGCWSIAAYDRRETMVYCKSHYGMKRQALHYANRRAGELVADRLCRYAVALAR